MKKVYLFGYGRIGRCIYSMLDNLGIKPIVIDRDEFVLAHIGAIKKSYLEYINENTPEPGSYVINAMPWNTSLQMAHWAVQNHCHYLDLTEDVDTRKDIKNQLEGLALDHRTAIACGMGLAPGMISSKAAQMIKRALDDGLEDITCKIRVGALHGCVNNLFRYAFTWSPVGVLNEYSKGDAIKYRGRVMDVHPLKGRETLFIDDVRYEAFYTSGGGGSVVSEFAAQPRVQAIDYKSIRLPGHLRACLDAVIRGADLGLEMEREVPVMYDQNDYVHALVSITGYKGRFSSYNDRYLQGRTWHRKYLPQHGFSAIEWTTAIGVVKVLVDLLDYENRKTGFLLHSDIHYPADMIEDYENMNSTFNMWTKASAA